jgi:N utilization substance protein A
MNAMNSALIQQIKLVADEKKIPRDNVADSLKDAIIKAYVKEFPETEVEVNINVDDGILEVNQLLKVVEPYEDLNDYTEIALADAKKHNGNITIGEVLKLPIDVAKLERPVQSHIFQIFKHNIINQSNVEIFKT